MELRPGDVLMMSCTTQDLPVEVLSVSGGLVVVYCETTGQRMEVPARILYRP